MIEYAEMIRSWSSKRGQSRRSKVLSTRPSTPLLMAATLTSTMLNTINKLFGPKVPTTEIAGLALSHDEAAQLVHICTALRNALNLQLDAIAKLPSISNEQVCSKLRQIQTRHTDIHIQLTSIVSKTKCSTVLWVREFADARAALEGKIVAINKAFSRVGLDKCSTAMLARCFGKIWVAPAPGATIAE